MTKVATSKERVISLPANVDNFCEQFGPRSGLTKYQALSGSKLFDTLMVFLRCFENNNLKKNLQTTTKNHEELPSNLQRSPFLSSNVGW